ncbi:Flagellar motor switch protein FliG [Anatilimnocola aggregata]|uniref:Flagellar motor switch protein FliG n=1 Tax=Anatilimnocola aggregata TaxID=2528021 RepID=A0A517Y9Y3_9BACT|nr:FliG C-terminal domain-containing protein [Anatilimnocola aggregata]QDU26972.1 Flagellar motor switch protein FliG [Anatilimnocola aggregata]
MNHKPLLPTALTTLQKAAVLINSLDLRAADALLDQMPEEHAARVRDAMLQLDGVSAEAQQEVIAEFLRNGGRLPQIAPAINDTGVELDLSPAANQALPADSGSTTHLQPFYFLREASPGLLADFLRHEHPQTVAVVLANLDPDQAARVLERLPNELSTESLARMARLYQLTDEVLADLADEIRQQLVPRMEAERRPQGLAGASAVLSALNDQHRTKMLGHLASRDHALVRQLGYLDASYSRSATLENPQPRHRDLDSLHAQPVRSATEPTITFSQLSKLNDETLKKIFAAADPQLILLALTGAEDKLVQRILRQLPTAAAVALRQRLNHPGALRLRDVDDAQRQLAQLAVDLHEQRLIQLPFLPAAKQHLSLQS